MPRVSISAHPLRGFSGARPGLDPPAVRVLRGGGVHQRTELIELEKAALRLGDADAHALAAGRVALDVAVLDGVVEDRGQTGDELADRRWPEWNPAPVAFVADVGAGGDGGSQVARLAPLLSLECEAHLGVDLVEATRSEEWEEMAA